MIFHDQPRVVLHLLGWVVLGHILRNLAKFLVLRGIVEARDFILQPGGLAAVDALETERVIDYSPYAIRQLHNPPTDQLGKIFLKVLGHALFKFRNFPKSLHQGVGVHVLHVFSGLLLHLLEFIERFLFLLGGVVQILLTLLLAFLGLLQ